ncbi:hypothetical protein MRX96_055617 [Rhipicephalus microplus]
MRATFAAVLLSWAIIVVTSASHRAPWADHTREFSCGRLYYRTFYMDRKREILFVGGMDKVFRLSLANINRTKCNDRSLSANKDVVSTCVYKGKREDYECRNHIKVIQPIGDGTKLYICGTNAQNPRDMEIYLTLRDIGRGIGKCPFDPDDNSTAVWVEHGNPGDMPGLYSGTVAEFTKADTVIFRSALFNRTTHEQSEFFMRTLKYDSMWLDKPNFVGSFDIGDHVFFFFRESAVEYINCGKVIYSRVARVCKKDTGGKNILTHNWATFLKARLNCSLPGEYPFYFNEIQAVYKFPDDDSNVYAVFTTSLLYLLERHDRMKNVKFACVFVTEVPHGSAVCSFRLSDIQGAFGGPVEDLFSTVRMFVFLSLAVHKVDVDGVDYLVYFAGTRDGLVYKIVEWKDRSGQSFSNLVDVIEASPGEPVRTIDISSECTLGSDDGVRQVRLDLCRGRHLSCLRCVRDPYCGWDRDHHECRSYVTGFLQDVSNATPDICEESVRRRQLHAHWGESVHLSCQGHHPELMEPPAGTTGPGTAHSKVPLWYHQHGRERRLVTPKRDKYIHTTGHGLVLMSLTERDSGHYDLHLESIGTLCSYNLTVDAETCGTPTETDYRKIYSNWCHEFEKYKLAMKTWQTKHAKCQGGGHPNDVTYQGRAPAA